MANATPVTKEPLAPVSAKEKPIQAQQLRHGAQREPKLVEHPLPNPDGGPTHTVVIKTY